MNTDVSRESSEVTRPDGADPLELLRVELAGLHAKVDELLQDSRAARPLLEKYVRLGTSKAGAAWAGVAGRRR